MLSDLVKATTRCLGSLDQRGHEVERRISASASARSRKCLNVTADRGSCTTAQGGPRLEVQLAGRRASSAGRGARVARATWNDGLERLRRGRSPARRPSHGQRIMARTSGPRPSSCPKTQSKSVARLRLAQRHRSAHALTFDYRQRPAGHTDQTHQRGFDPLRRLLARRPGAG